MTLLSVVRVKREPYDDVHWRGSVEESRQPAPVEASYELAVEVDGERRVFDAEVRTGSQVDFDDDLGDLMSARGLPRAAWSAVCEAVFVVHEGSAADFPLDLRSPPPEP